MKKFLVVLMVLLCAFTCFANGEEEAAAAAVEEKADYSAFIPTGDHPTEQKKIIVWSSSSGDTFASLERCAAAFNASQSDYVVELQYTSSIYTKMVSSTVEERPNIIHSTSNESARYIETVGSDNQLIVPVHIYADYENYDMSNLINSLAGVYARDGKWMSIPIGSSNVGFYFNLDIMEKAGIDYKSITSIEGLYEAGKKLQAAGYEKPIFLRKDSGDFLNYGLVTEGFDWFNNGNGRDGVPTAHLLEQDDIKKAVMTYFNTIVKMRDEGMLWDPSFSGSDQRNMFAKGDIPILCGYISTYHSLWKLCQGTGCNFSYAPYPTLQASSTNHGQLADGFCYFICNVDDAWAEYGSWQFMKLLMTDEWASDFAVSSGYLPVTKTASSTEAYQAYVNSENPWSLDVLAAQEATEANLCQPLLPYQKDYAATVQTVLNQLMTDTTYTADAAFADLVAGVQSSIEMYWLEKGVIL